MGDGGGGGLGGGGFPTFSRNKHFFFNLLEHENDPSTFWREYKKLKWKKIDSETGVIGTFTSVKYVMQCAWCTVNNDTSKILLMFIKLVFLLQ